MPSSTRHRMYRQLEVINAMLLHAGRQRFDRTALRDLSRSAAQQVLRAGREVQLAVDAFEHEDSMIIIFLILSGACLFLCCLCVGVLLFHGWLQGNGEDREELWRSCVVYIYVVLCIFILCCYVLLWHSRADHILFGDHPPGDHASMIKCHLYR